MPDSKPPPLPPGSTTDDFYAYLQQHQYIFIPTRKLWPAASVDGVVPRVGRMKASRWLDRNRAVQQLTWAPGEPQIIRHKYVDGKWIDHANASVFNFYRPPDPPIDGDSAKAQRWVDHLSLLYPETVGDMIWWCAHRVQHPNVKINHAIVMGGDPGIGKDTLLEPVRRAVGYWNTATIQPPMMVGRFNGFLKSVILVVSEARDLGEFNRYQFYEHMKPILASPPETLPVDEKNVQEYQIPNLCGVIFTTNHKNSLFLTADDRRHLVCWSDCKQDDFDRSFWTDFWQWYERGGFAHVAAYLATYDLGAFDPKAPPPKTQAFWDMVNSTRPAEAAELADLLEDMGWPEAVYPSKLEVNCNNEELRFWMKERKSRHLLGKRLDDIGYEAITNPDTQDGLWKIGGRRQTVYALKRLSRTEQLTAITRMILS
jgi:Family of unknown function (DUF5906)